MKLKVRVSFETDGGERFFGEGPYRLLQAIQSHNSLRAAAQSMGMAYTKAYYMIRNTEERLGFPLIHRSTGGKGGGGSTLTPQAAALLERYAAFRAGCDEAAWALYRQHFAGFPLPDSPNGEEPPR